MPVAKHFIISVRSRETLSGHISCHFIKSLVHFQNTLNVVRIQPNAQKKYPRKTNRSDLCDFYDL